MSSDYSEERGGDEAAEFIIASDPYVHGDGSYFPYLLTMVRVDGCTERLHVASLERIAELIFELQPERVRGTGPDALLLEAMLCREPDAMVH